MCSLKIWTRIATVDHSRSRLPVWVHVVETLLPRGNDRRCTAICVVLGEYIREGALCIFAIKTQHSSAQLIGRTVDRPRIARDGLNSVSPYIVLPLPCDAEVRVFAAQKCGRYSAGWSADSSVASTGTSLSRIPLTKLAECSVPNSLAISIASFSTTGAGVPKCRIS